MTSATTGGGTAAAQALYDKFTGPPSNIAPPQKLKAKPPTGKTIVFLQTQGEPTNALIGQELSKAAAVLGWHITILNQTGAIESTQAAFAQALALKPDGIAVNATPPEQLTQQLADAKAAKVPVAFTSVQYDKPYVFPIVGNTGGTPLLEHIADVLTATVAVDSQGKANVASVTIPAFAILKPYVAAIKADLAKYCSSCTFSEVDGEIKDIGTGFPGKVVSAIQADPKINYLLFDVADFDAGVQSALSDAGLASKVKIGGSSPTAAAIQAVKDGTNFAWVGTEPIWFAWRYIDFFARYYTNTPAPTELDAPLPLRIIVKSNVTDSLGTANDPALGIPKAAVEAAFRQAWGL